MITYASDHDLTIKTFLREYIAKFSNHTEFDRTHLYTVDAKRLKGPLAADCVWDRAAFKVIHTREETSRL